MYESTDANAVRDEGLEALELLGNEQRISILRELAEADHPLAFSELRRRVGIEDTGRFNYHLTELQSRFVRKSDGGYELGHAGQRVVVAAGDLDPVAAFEEQDEPTAAGETCPVCGEPDCDKLIHVHLSGRR